jgi:OmpA-OmpF porin, OOP family
MRWYRISAACALAGGLLMLILPLTLQAQDRLDPTDFRGRAYSVDELEKALFPEAEATPAKRMRGISPSSTTPTPVLPPPQPSVIVPIYFEFDSDRLLSAYYPNLDQIGEVLMRRPNSRIQIEGHTDSIGLPDYNRSLAYRRAESVKRYLVQRFSIPRDRLRVESKGEDFPMVSNSTAEGREKNRRVEFVNLGQ